MAPRLGGAGYPAVEQEARDALDDLGLVREHPTPDPRMTFSQVAALWKPRDMTHVLVGTRGDQRRPRSRVMRTCRCHS